MFAVVHHRLEPDGAENVVSTHETGKEAWAAASEYVKRLSSERRLRITEGAGGYQLDPDDPPPKGRLLLERSERHEIYVRPLRHTAASE